MRTMVVTLALGFVLMSPAVRAQSEGKAAAEALFEEGKRLVLTEQYEEACPKFAESQRLDPAPGTLLNLADCYEKTGRTASAWATWLEAAAAAHDAQQRDREDFANDRAQALESRLVRVRIVVPETSRVEGLRIQRNGVSVEFPMWGTAVPVDPGSHVVVASAPGYEDWRTSVTVVDGVQPVDVTVPTLVARSVPTVVEPARPPQVPAAAVAGPVRTPLAPSNADTDTGASQRTWGYVAGGVGVVGLAAGAVFGVRVLNKNEKADDVCPSGRACTLSDKSRYESAISDAKDARVLSITGFALGGAALVGGAVLVLTAPSSSETALQVAPAVEGEGFTATLRGAW